MYDLYFGRNKISNITSLADYNVNSSQYIYKKYDSLQFVQSNVYYASNYREYSFWEIVKRLMIKKRWIH
jgi:hypothetical protein